MAYRKRRDIRAVRNPEEQTDRLIEEIIQELNNEDGSFEVEIQIIIASTIANGFNTLAARGY